MLFGISAGSYPVQHGWCSKVEQRKTNPQTEKEINDKGIRSAVAKYSSGSCTVIEFLCSISHCCDNVTHPLNQNDDTGSSTDEYQWDDVDDSTHSPVAASSNTTASATVVTASCDVCLNAPRVKVVFSTVWTCNFLSAMYWHTHRHQFSLSCVSRCNIFYRPVLQLDMKQLQSLSRVQCCVFF